MIQIGLSSCNLQGSPTGFQPLYIVWSPHLQNDIVSLGNVPKAKANPNNQGMQQLPCEEIVQSTDNSALEKTDKQFRDTQHTHIKIFKHHEP